MAITNYERVGKAMALLKAGLAPFVEREFAVQCLAGQGGDPVVQLQTNFGGGR